MEEEQSSSALRRRDRFQSGDKKSEFEAGTHELAAIQSTKTRYDNGRNDTNERDFADGSSPSVSPARRANH